MLQHVSIRPVLKYIRYLYSPLPVAGAFERLVGCWAQPHLWNQEF
jgi:hypothetical protein